MDEALIALEAVLSRAPDHAVALAHLADIQLRRGRLVEAASAPLDSNIRSSHTDNGFRELR
ncbi:MAG: hypothetical protein ACRDJF_12515 [Actinomycetota bacterium]